MTLHLPTLLTVCVAALATSAGVMTLYAATRRTYRGFAWWVVAQWLLALGCLLQLFRDSAPELLPLANLLLLQWPITVLAGMRRFAARQPSRVPMLADWLLLSLAWGVWLATWAAEGSLATRVLAFAAGAAVLHLYSAATLWHMAESRGSAAMKLLVGLELSAAALQALRVGFAIGGPVDGSGQELLLASGLVILVSSLVMVYLALMLTAERSEANLNEVHRQLRFLANIDVLTRVPNRRHFHELAAQTLAEGARPPCTLMMFDVDHFKRINDTGGHESGDQVLRQIAALLGRHARGTDRVARWGGEEFLLLMPHTDAAGAQTALQRLQGELRETQPSVPPGCGTLTFSIGVATTSASDLSVDVLVARADAAMYAAKQAGRNRIVAAG